MSRIKTQFSKAAPFYDDFAIVQRHTFMQLQAQVLADFSAGHSVAHFLDIGCGTGANTLELAKALPGSKGIGQDISSDMILWARAKHQSESVQFQTADIHTIETPMDLIVSNAVFQWVPDLAGFFQTMQALMAPGARLYFSCYGPETYIELKHSLSALLGKPILLSSSGFRRLDEVAELAESSWPGMQLHVEKIKQSFPSLKQLLKSIKLTGTRGDGLPSVKWTPSFLEQLEHQYKEKYGQILATYEVLYGSYVP